MKKTIGEWLDLAVERWRERGDPNALRAVVRHLQRNGMTTAEVERTLLDGGKLRSEEVAIAVLSTGRDPKWREHLEVQNLPAGDVGTDST